MCKENVTRTLRWNRVRAPYRELLSLMMMMMRGTRRRGIVDLEKLKIG
jgi:hypothetical protein